MTTITYTNLQTLLNITVAAATCESIIDHAINLLNTYGADLPNMTGTAGSKTWNGESNEAGAIMEVASAVYISKYVVSGATSSSYGLGPLSTSNSVSTGGSSPENLAKSLARELTELDVAVG